MLDCCYIVQLFGSWTNWEKDFLLLVPRTFFAKPGFCSLVRVLSVYCATGHSMNMYLEEVTCSAPTRFLRNFRLRYLRCQNYIRGTDAVELPLTLLPEITHSSSECEVTPFGWLAMCSSLDLWKEMVYSDDLWTSF